MGYSALAAKDTSGAIQLPMPCFRRQVNFHVSTLLFRLPGLICLLLSTGLAVVRVIGGVHIQSVLVAIFAAFAGELYFYYKGPVFGIE